jgi:DeoR/GlpR family transcriptional regulator of sugar metabolism
MLAPERHRVILRLLAERGRLTLPEVRARFGISAATARRDAAVRAAAGLVQRILGAQSEKWGRPAAFRFSPGSAFHPFSPDRQLSRVDRTALGRAGLKLHVVSAK